MSASEPPSEGLSVADTVVVNYFLAVGAFELLRQLLGGAVRVPRAVYDPDEPDEVADEAASELRRGLRLHRKRSTDRHTARELRERSARALPHFEALPELSSRGGLRAIDLAGDELTTYARLRDARFVSRFSLVAGLGRGEAAALAIAVNRQYDLATNDQDAIKVATGLAPNIGIHRIRSLLTRAADVGLVTKDEARELDAAMVRAGFWDRGTID